MPRIRYLKPEFFSDEDLAELKFETRIAFAGLWCYADKSGRLEDRPKFLKAMIFPYDNVDMEKQLQILNQPKHNGKPFILRYELESKKLIQILNWEKHQKPHHTETPSKIPAFPKEKENIPVPLKEKEIIIMGMGTEKQNNPSMKLKNGEHTVKETLTTNNNRFELFWKAYPKKKSKGNAEKVWEKLKPTDALVDIMICSIEIAKKSEDWIKENGKYIPYPATWLNAKGWEDEISDNSSEINQPGLKAWAKEIMEEEQNGGKEQKRISGIIGHAR